MSFWRLSRLTVDFWKKFLLIGSYVMEKKHAAYFQISVDIRSHKVLKFSRVASRVENVTSQADITTIVISS